MLRNSRGSRNGSGRRNPRTIVRSVPTTAIPASARPTRTGSGPPRSATPISVVAPSAPDVGEAAGKRHHHDIGEQVAVDDPRGVPELGEGRLPQLVRGGEVEEDRRQRRRGDQELEAGEEDADPEDGEEAPGAEPAHGRRVQGRTAGALRRGPLPAADKRRPGTPRPTPAIRPALVVCTASAGAAVSLVQHTTRPLDRVDRSHRPSLGSTLIDINRR